MSSTAHRISPWPNNSSEAGGRAGHAVPGEEISARDKVTDPLAAPVEREVAELRGLHAIASDDLQDGVLGALRRSYQLRKLPSSM